MDDKTLADLIEASLENCRVQVEGDGRHFEAVIISNEFEGKNTLARQRCVYAVIQSYINNGTVHAFTMKTYTPEEWDRVNE